MAAGVPVVLSTDDAGVSRIDLSNEYFRAARDYPLGYRDLKEIARNSIEHAFLDAEDEARRLSPSSTRLHAAFETSRSRRKRGICAQHRHGRSRAIASLVLCDRCRYQISSGGTITIT